MSKNVKVNGVTYNGVNSVKLQAADGGEAIFYDSAPTVPQESDINFWDYDGTLLYAWTLAELAGKTELPPLPSHDGLVCQGWNWTLQDIKSVGHAVDVGAMYITDDGKTRIYIHLEEGRTSPMLGCCPNGTVTVDWGDGTTPDTLTGTSTTAVKWTPNHAYAAPGDYVIKLTVEGIFKFYSNTTTEVSAALLRYSSGADLQNWVYQGSIRKIEIGTGVAALGDGAFSALRNLECISIPSGITNIPFKALHLCSSLRFAAIPIEATSLETSALTGCFSLRAVSLPRGIATAKSFLLQNGYCLKRVVLPDGLTNLANAQFQNCYALTKVHLPDELTAIPSNLLYSCYALASIVIPGGVTNIGENAFYKCYGVKVYDFTHCPAVPTLANSNAFTGIAADCVINVPASLVDTWKAATNWSIYADQIVGVSAE